MLLRRRGRPGAGRDGRPRARAHAPGDAPRTRRSSSRFADRTVFVQLRVDPFYRRVQERRPEVAGAVAPLIDGMLTATEALCHGDFTPKNMLAHGGGFTLVDYETAHLGDPTMDLGLFFAHLLLKAFRPARRARALLRPDARRSGGLRRGGHFRPAGGAAAARRRRTWASACWRGIDGTSPVDYLPERAGREAVRRLGRRLLLDPPPRWEDVLDAARHEMET